MHKCSIRGCILALVKSAGLFLLLGSVTNIPLRSRFLCLSNTCALDALPPRPSSICVPCCAGNCWVSGTLPDGLRRLRNVTLINLSTNWLNGTLPAWLSELIELRVLNLGSNKGGNEGNGTEQLGLGLLGSIPAGIGQLTKLRELNLEANSLSGELPKELCNGGASGLSSGA